MIYESSIASWKTVEKCGGVLENTVAVEGDEEPIRRYWIDNLKTAASHSRDFSRELAAAPFI